MDVSILIPVYADSLEKVYYLDECVASAASQGIPVVANDGSSVSLEQVRRKFDCVWLDLPHKGKSHARNAAADAAPTDLIYPLDADDVLTGDLSFLAEQWNDTPLYTDIVKWYSESRSSVHRFSAFDCETALRKSVFSVNVLHSKAQWQAIGGWPEGVQLFEDWMYNIKLFWTFCGRHVQTPMVTYRQHEGQSTQVLRKDQPARLKKVRAWAIEYAKENGMGCCGKRRRRGSRVPTTMLPAEKTLEPTTFGITRTLPGSSGDGFVDARYSGGKGRGKHIYRGLSTGHPYAVRTGVTIRCDIRDTCSQEDKRLGHSKSLLIRVPVAQPSPPPPTPVKVEIPPPTPVEIPVLPQVDDAMVADIASMTVKDILTNVDAWDDATRAAYLEAEKKGKARITAIKLLEK